LVCGGCWFVRDSDTESAARAVARGVTWRVAAASLTAGFEFSVEVRVENEEYCRGLLAVCNLNELHPVPIEVFLLLEVYAPRTACPNSI